MNTSSNTHTYVRLDHAGFIVSDLDTSCELMRQLGFTLTQRADHTRTDEKGALVSAGSSQRSIMLGNGYIEIMQITDPTAGHQLATAPTARFGLHVLAFGTSDAQACHGIRVQNGVAAGPVLLWAREIREEGLRGLAQFAYFGSQWTPQDPSYICWTEHRNPELLRSPGLVRHDNGALGLAALRYRGPRGRAQAWIAQLLAAGAQRANDEADSVELALPNARLHIDFDDTHSDVLPSALVFDVSDCAWLRARCAQLGLPAQDRGDGSLDVNLSAQLGLHCTFRAKTATS